MRTCKIAFETGINCEEEATHVGWWKDGITKLFVCRRHSYSTNFFFVLPLKFDKNADSINISVPADVKVGDMLLFLEAALLMMVQEWPEPRLKSDYPPIRIELFEEQPDYDEGDAENGPDFTPDWAKPLPEVPEDQLAQWDYDRDRWVYPDEEDGPIDRRH